MQANRILRQYAEESAVLWGLRSRVARKPDASFKRLVDFDWRLEAHLDGLRTAGKAGCEIALEVLGEGGRGALFAAAATALALSGEKGLIELLPQCKGEKAFVEMASALAWVSPAWFIENAAKWVMAEDTGGIALIACSLMRHDPGESLDFAANSGDPFRSARAFRTAGELGRRDMIGSIESALRSENSDVRGWAAWSGARFRSPAAQAALLELVFDMPFGEIAAPMAGRACDAPAIRASIARPGLSPDSLRRAIMLAGHLGDPVTVPLLLDQMQDDIQARQAAEAFSNITGVDLVREHLVRPPPETPDDADLTADDPDTDLAWPDHWKASVWWENHTSSYESGVRYVAGVPARSNAVGGLLNNRRQGFRAIAAVELSVQRPGQPILNVRAPAFRQQASQLV